MDIMPIYTQAMQKPKGHQYLAYLSIFYVGIMLLNALLTNRYIGTENFFVLGGSFTSPFVFILDNIIAEIYGYKITRNIIFCSIFCQTLFVIFCQLITHAPSPEFTNTQIYSQLFGNSLVHIHLSFCFSYLISMLLNAKILTKWKVLLKGKKFWLRSLGSTTLSEFIYSLLAIILMEIQTVKISSIFLIVFLSYSIKVAYSIVFLIPAQLLVSYVREKAAVDVYDFERQYSPSKYLLAGKI